MLGVSPDSEASHVKFKQKFDLPFTLLADPDHATAEAYGVWVEKSMYGKTYMGVERSTFVIGADGNVDEGDAEGEARDARRRRARGARRSGRRTSLDSAVAVRERGPAGASFTHADERT